eukprot:CAMPEP_0204296302 /NCGR_PEP_ID=MMETSP0468-20130131/71221_1 /ASSEMBLY_ACC=CAM_ASM_000383 /TAXON_ID=2969 /ORGANISM="Oxyrrhis marina" /LENGTH=152 /DNA_ID=CAMNT_0051274995 /DNA_START=414 /DNA_END=869 /DNA_ORIENTATION=-
MNHRLLLKAQRRFAQVSGKRQLPVLQAAEPTGVLDTGTASGTLALCSRCRIRRLEGHLNASAAQRVPARGQQLERPLVQTHWAAAEHWLLQRRQATIHIPRHETNVAVVNLFHSQALLIETLGETPRQRARERDELFESPQCCSLLQLTPQS